MNGFQTGELVDVALRGARVVENGAKHLHLSVGGNDLYLAAVALPSVRITRVAPAEWPPQVGDVWEDAHEGSWWARSGDDDVELQAQGGGACGIEFVLEHYGPMRLAYRRGWSPAPAPAVATPEQLDRRAEVIAGLREMADWYESDPDLPMRPYGFENLHSISAGTEEADRTELFRIAALFGEDPDLTVSHPAVRKTFRGGVGVRAYYIPAAKPADEATRAGDSDFAPEVPVVATTQPGPDVTHGEGKVGSSVAGLPTAPDDGHVQIAGWGGVPGRCGVECSCGTTLDGFDTIAEAEALRVQHAIDADAPQDGHVYECCGKVGRISRHNPWCEIERAKSAGGPGAA